MENIWGCPPAGFAPGIYWGGGASWIW